MTHYPKLRNTILFLFFQFLLYSCEKEIYPTPEKIPVYEIKDNINNTFDPISALTTPIYSTVEAYPNPFTTIVSIYCGHTPDQIIISDKDGNLKKFEPGSSNSSYDFSEANPGVYYCEVFVQGSVVRLQLFKTKN
jgi:hypothetical protein